MSAFTASTRTVLCAAVAAAVLAACASAPPRPEGSAQLRSRLTSLQSDPQLAGRAPLALQEAETAVSLAEMPSRDNALATHRVFMADRKISIAESQAQARLAVDQRIMLGEQRDAMRLAARTREADVANQRTKLALRDALDQRDAAQLARTDAEAARSAADLARNDADLARNDADLARNDADAAQRNALALQSEINELQGKVTDRGLVLTLGDVLFATGTAELNTGADSHMAQLAKFLNHYPNRSTVIEGHTDSVGSTDSNQALSQRRADAVKRYLVRQGIAAERLTAQGLGESSPVGDNASITGRQQNRRVEVIVENEKVSAR
jgi:outer membrane protein OmpA-like peptidoglycan-associated protein